MQEHDIDAVEAGECLDRGGAGIAGCGADDGHARIACRQHVVEQRAKELQRHVLEGERRPVEKLLHEQTGFELHHRHDRGMAEAGVGFVAQRLKRLERQRVADERLHHTRGEFGIRHAAQPAPVGWREVRPGLRHVKPAVLREARQERACEVAHGRLPAGGDVAHGRKTRSETASLREAS